ncbi:MAG: hypothetical protein SVX43_22365, partial [Cyanobacteriota bacterium]|nr:hypothetical protein [Cyanobacteriota bacterium]
MKGLTKYLGVTATAAIAYLLLGTTPVRAATFTFSLELGTADPADANYGIGRHLLSGTFSGEDRDGDGWLGVNELSSFEASWANFSFDLDDATGFWGAETGPDSLLINWIEFARGALRLDYKRIAPLYQQFRVYICPQNFDCEPFRSIDFPIADGLIGGDILLGFENIFNPGFNVSVASTEPDPNPPRTVPEPSLLGGLLL